VERLCNGGFVAHNSRRAGGRAANVTDVPEAEVEPVLYHGRFVFGEDYPSSAANAFMLFQLRRPLVWIQIGLPLVLIPVLSTALDKYPWSLQAAFGVDLLIIVANLISWMTKRQNLTNQFKNSAAAGTSRELSMTESTLNLQTDDSSSRTPYRQYESADTNGDFVFLRVRGSSIRSILPRQLFTDESLAFLRSKVL
jgi:hypothetical protein